MAKKGNAVKIPQTDRGGAPAGHRFPASQANSNALYLMQLRPHGLKISASRQQLRVTVQTDDKSEVPQPIKITHAG
ncbi:MAG TPA: hypothetical protein VHG89_12780 [Verrucomicrobiae bacterium]|nr:hypothetical protein [Verrucomicrobiae bacterium]